MNKISEILPMIKQPIKLKNQSGYGFEQVLRKEMKRVERNELSADVDGAEITSKGESFRTDEPDGRGRIQKS